MNKKTFMKKANKEKEVASKLLRDFSEAKIKNKAKSPDSTPGKEIDIKFGAYMSAKRKLLRLSRPQLADLLKVSPSTVKRIENGKTTVGKNRNLIDCICRELNMDQIVVYREFGINIADKTSREAKRIKLDKAKKDFVDALQNSQNYFYYFVYK